MGTKLTFPRYVCRPCIKKATDYPLEHPYAEVRTCEDCGTPGVPCYEIRERPYSTAKDAPGTVAVRR